MQHLNKNYLLPWHTAVGIIENLNPISKKDKKLFEKIVGRISFFVNSGMKLITETAKMIAFTEMWDEICTKRFKISEPKFKRFRYGMQVNSLGLTESQPENNVYRILIQMLPVVIAKNSRARQFSSQLGTKHLACQDHGTSNGAFVFNK